MHALTGALIRFLVSPCAVLGAYCIPVVVSTLTRDLFAPGIASVWAPGDGGFPLPDFLGANLFGANGFQGFNIEIHYDNPGKNTMIHLPSFDLH
jgi:hypothetical protein